MNEVAEKSLRSSSDSWHVGTNIPGKPRVYMPYIGGVPVYAAKCEQVAGDGYNDFALS